MASRIRNKAPHIGGLDKDLKQEMLNAIDNVEQLKNIIGITKFDHPYLHFKYPKCVHVG